MEKTSEATSTEREEDKPKTDLPRTTPAEAIEETPLAAVNKLDAECLVIAQQYAAAQKILSDLLSNVDSNVEALLAFGFFLASKGERKKADQYFRKALNLSTEGYSDWERAQRGFILTSRARDEGDSEYLALQRKAQRYSSTSQKRYFFLQGKAAHLRGWHGYAKALFELSIERGGYKDDWLRWAFCCVALGHFEEALNYFRNSPDTYGRVLQLIEELQKVNDGQCPSKMLRLKVGSELRDVIYALDRRMKDAESPEQPCVRFSLLVEYETKMEYDSLHSEVDSYLPK